MSIANRKAKCDQCGYEWGHEQESASDAACWVRFSGYGGADLTIHRSIQAQALTHPEPGDRHACSVGCARDYAERWLTGERLD